MTLNGIDVGGGEPDTIADDVDYDFLVVKATEGTTFVSRSCDTIYQAAKRRGKLLGVYHFAATGDPVAEADFFVANVRGYVGEAILVLDFEADAVDAWGGAGAKMFLDRVHAATGVKPVIYVSGSVAARSDMQPIADADYGLWVASWGANTPGGYRDPGDAPTGRWRFAFIHQYTSEGTLPGYAGRLDLDIAYGDADTWAKYAAVGGATTTGPAEPAPSKTVAQLAAEVWAGAWGDGEDRRQRLTAAGYDYAAVQAVVDATVLNARRTYTVQSGDSLSKIATKFSIAGGWSAIFAANRDTISDPGLIYPGQVLTIP